MANIKNSNSSLILPNLIIAGVHKAGTTSVFTYLSRHPAVCASSKKEIGFFMPLKYNHPIPDIKEYSAFFSHCDNNRKYILEASPSYLYGNEKIREELKRNLKDVKLIVILRNPTERLFSFYESIKTNGRLQNKDSFKSFVEKSINFVGKTDLEKTPENEFYLRGVEEGIYINYLTYWLEAFNSANFKIFFFEDLKNDTSGFMKKLCNWLNIDFLVYQQNDFKIDNKTTSYKAGNVHRLAYKFYMRMEPFWRRNVQLKRKLRDFYKYFNASSYKNKLSDEDRNYVDSFYSKYNTELKNKLLKSGINNLPNWLN